MLLLPLLRSARRFVRGLDLRLAGSERGLIRATSRELHTLPGSARGVLSFDASGDLVRGRKGAVTFTATRLGASIQGAGLEMSARPGSPWTSCSPGSEVVLGARYRVGELYLRLD